MESQRAKTWTLTPRYIVFNCSFFFMENINLKSTSLRPFGVPPCFSPRNRSLAFVVPCHVANKSLECSKATIVDGGKNLMERFGLEITFIIIIRIIINIIIIIFSDEVSTLTIHFSNIHYPSLSIKLIPYYSIVLIPDVDLLTFHIWSFFCGYRVIH